MNAIGRPHLRVEDRPLLTGAAVYTGDLVRADLLDAVFVRSTMPHARIVSIDASPALAIAGVVGVFTNEHLADIPRYSTVAGLPDRLSRSVLADGVVRFVGEPIAVVVASSLARALDAAESVVVTYEPMRSVVDVDDAASVDAPQVVGNGSNVAVMFPATAPVEAVFGAAAIAIDITFENQRIAIMSLEGNAILAEPDGVGGLRVHASSQAPHYVRNQMAPLIGLSPDQLHFTAPATGGAFGAKSVAEHELTTIAALALRLARAVRWVQLRSEAMTTSHGRAQRQHVRVCADATGKLLAVHADIVADGGGYPAVGAYLPMLTQRMLAGSYDVVHVTSSACAVATNTAPPTAFRGAGRPEATCLLERSIDIIAAELGLDPLDVRRRNLIARDAFPYTTPTGAVYDVGDYRAALDIAESLADYATLRAEQSRRRAAGEDTLLGIGVATYVEVNSGPAPTEFAEVEVHADATATVKVGTFSHGQGHHTTMAQIAADMLHLPMPAIRVIDGDTALVARGEGTYASRSVQMGGSAVHRAAERVVQRARRLAAELLEASVADVTLDDDGFAVVGVPARAVRWHDVARRAERERPDDDPTWRSLVADCDWERAATYPFGAHIAVVEIDAETGKTTLIRYVAVDDCGTVINPLLATGQVHGGIAQGAAQALFEHVRYDDVGNLLTGTLLDYAVPSAAEFPMFETDHTVTPTPLNPLGAKGIGESGTTGAIPAVHNAIVDALAHLGVRHLDMPCTPQKVWAALRSGTSDGELRITRGGA